MNYITITEYGDDANYNVATVKCDSFESFKQLSTKALEEHFDGDVLDLFNEDVYDEVLKYAGYKNEVGIRMKVDDEHVTRDVVLSQTWLYE